MTGWHTVSVEAARPYAVHIGSCILESLGETAAFCVSGRKAALVTDDTVAALYANRAANTLTQAGFAVCTYVFPHGERSKNGHTYLELLDFLAQHRLTRSDLIVALGGGVTGDLAGFAAATYLRGIAYIQVPTTLLAMVDSSVGGKTAIDLPSGKNLAGAFHQPRAVLCDVTMLKTLPTDYCRDGWAEVIKYAILGSPSLFSQLERGSMDQPQEDVITACVRMKRDFVARDEYDTGCRQLLNLGHTLGHAVEKVSNFELSHGKAVSIGMAMIARAAVKFGFCPPEARDRILAILRQYHLPTETNLPPKVLLEAALSDKKRQGQEITLVVPKEIGLCRLHRIPESQLESWIRAGL